MKDSENESINLCARQNWTITYDISKLINKTKEYDWITTPKVIFTKTNIEQWSDFHDNRFVAIAREVLNDYSPEMLPAFNAYWEQKESRMWSQWITSWTHFDKFCSWLFPFLFKIEEKIDFSSLDSYQQRIPAYLYERLLNVYWNYNQSKIDEYPFYMIVDERQKPLWRQDIGAKIWTLYSTIKKMMYE